MLKVYGFRGAWGLLSVSPFCSKLEVWLRMAAIPYKNAAFNPMEAPRGKAPYINTDQGFLGDSELIIEHLTQKHQVSLDEGLSPEQRAQALLLRRLCEQHLYSNLVYSRWMVDRYWPTVRQSYFGHMPMPLRAIAPVMARRKVKKILSLDGTLGYSHEEILASTKQDVEALAVALGDKPFFLGEEPHGVDATTYSWLEALLLPEVARDFAALVEPHEKLVAYCQRMRQRYVEGYQQPASA